MTGRAEAVRRSETCVCSQARQRSDEHGIGQGDEHQRPPTPWRGEALRDLSLFFEEADGRGTEMKRPRCVVAPRR
jgi:hypothetical protein